ncbi:hypothetical protein LJR231_001565 [Phyllobacterium sp. LjRoot231]|uniref:hypothetical protein n=1 Tax=Phyllobacterium sp. LjRoot231 TaxID=3342289 RepID=UPI003ECCF708
MPAIKLNAFTGEQPRIIPRLLPATAAQSAVNTRLDDGGLTPTRKSVQVATLISSTAKTIYKHLGVWREWETVVDAVPGPVADDRLYYTGDGVPKVSIAGTEYPLAVPFPAVKLTATVTLTSTADIVTRTYVYTYVTGFGEESEPSPASTPVDWRPGQTMTLSGFVAPPAGRNITKRRIYRSQSGQSGTYFYLIDETAAVATNYVDAIAVDGFQEQLPSANYNAPPDDLTGLTAMPNGIMAAFVGRKVYFCQPYQPHAWPEIYVITVDFPVIGLGAIGSSLVVATTGNPYFLTGSHPDSMQQTKLEQNLPCINARGIADLGFAIAYPSNEGLVAVRADSSIGLVTTQLFSPDGWRALSPSTFVSGQIYGRYVAFYDTVDVDGVPQQGAIFIDIAGTPFLIRSDTQANAVFFEIETGALNFLVKASTAVHRFDSPDGLREKMYWRSKIFVLSYPENFGAIIVDATENLTGEETANLNAQIAAVEAANAALIAAGSIMGDMNSIVLNEVPLNGDILAIAPTLVGVINVGVFADGVKVAQIFRTNQVCRLPDGFTARSWEIDVSGDIDITQIVMGKTVSDIIEVQ